METTDRDDIRQGREGHVRSPASARRPLLAGLCSPASERLTVAAPLLRIVRFNLVVYVVALSLHIFQQEMRSLLPPRTHGREA